MEDFFSSTLARTFCHKTTVFDAVFWLKNFDKKGFGTAKITGIQTIQTKLSESRLARRKQDVFKLN